MSVDIVNDLETRSHVSDMLIEADAREEYHDWLHAHTSVGLDDTNDWIVATQCPSVVDIENELAETIARQTAIAELKGVTLDQYREDLADRRDSLMDDILHARASARIANAK